MIYYFCPRCGEKYEEVNKENINAFPCKNCKLTFYNNPKPATVALLINEKDELLMVKRAIEPYKGDWDLPGGFLDAGESFGMAIKRELKEELNLSIETPLNIAGSFSEIYCNKGRDDEKYSIVILVYEVHSNFNDADIMCLDDVEKYSFFKKNDLPDNIAFPEKREFLNNYFRKEN